MTSFQIAIQAGKRDAIRALVECPEWEELITNHQTLPLAGNREPRQTPMRTLLRNYPDVALTVFDNCIKSVSLLFSMKNGYFRPNRIDAIDYNFTLLDDTYMVKDAEGRLLTGEGDPFMDYEEGGKLKPDVRTYATEPDVIYQNHPLRIIVSFRFLKISMTQ